MGWFNAIAPFAGGLLGDVVGGFMEQDENAKARNQQDQTNQKNYDMQKEFAQMGLRWKVADAMAAGIHPLAALGASGYSASPSYVSGGPDNSKSDMVKSMGQNISRAVSAGATAPERAMMAEQIRGMTLDNNLKEYQLKKTITDMNSVPAFPTYGANNNMSGGGVSDLFGRSDQIQASVEIPPASQTTFEVTRTGLRPQPSRQLAQANQNSMLSNISWDIDNKVVPFMSGRASTVKPDPRRYPLPRWADTYRWNRWAGEWQPHATYRSKPGFRGYVGETWNNMQYGNRY